MPTVPAPQAAEPGPTPTLRRAAVVLLAYGLSVGGWAWMLIGGHALLRHETGLLRALPLLWGLAWGAHLRMSLAWVQGRVLPPAWPRWGTLAGVLSLASPLLLVLAGAGGARPPISGAWIAIGLMTGLCLPAVLLALWLLRFHRRTPATP